MWCPMTKVGARYHLTCALRVRQMMHRRINDICS